METTWTTIGQTSDFPLNLGSCVEVNGTQIAIFRLETDQQWYAVQNLNPQNQRTVLSRGIVGDAEGTPFVACPLHKYRYSLVDGAGLTDPQYELESYEVKQQGEELLVLA